VNVIDLAMVCQVAADVGAAAQEAKPATRDELAENLRVERAEIVIDFP
jgi:hypothetical protein